MRLDDLNEGVGGNVFFHGTHCPEAVRIVLDDRLEGRTQHNVRPHNAVRPRDLDPFGSINGVSLTRSVHFARSWRSGGGIVFGFDADRLRQRFRIQQIDYYGRRREAEEFVIGSIAPLSRYLVSISASADTARELAEEGEEWCYDEILNHPLFKVEGGTWHPTTGVHTKLTGPTER